MFLVLSLIFPIGIFAKTPTASVSKPAPTPVAYDLPYPGILPDHPLYFLKTIRDKIVDLFTSNPEKRVEFLLLMADKRLVMGRLLMEKENEELARSTISKGEKYFLRATEELVLLRKRNLESGDRLRERLRTAYKKHEEVVGGKWKDIDQLLMQIEQNLR